MVAGAADDDPSAITTYSIAGASYGYGLLWAPLVAFPLLGAVALMCARLGMVSGRGLAHVIRLRYPAPVLWGACLLLFVANTFQLGADLGGMGAVLEMMTGVRAYVWTPLIAALVTGALIWSDYEHLSRVFRWLALALFAYAVAALLARPQWAHVLRSTFVPQVRWDGDYLSTLVGIFGSAISPYLFFWQAAQVVDEERAMGRETVQEREGATRRELDDARTDVLSGMAFACLIIYFVILTTAATLYASGQRNIETAQQAAEALRPVAGQGAYLLFTVGLIGAGMMGVPALAASAAYAFSEAMRWRRASLHERPGRAPKFYGVFAVAVVAGLGLNYVGLSPVRMLFLAAILNGVLAAPLIALVTLLTSDETVMGERVNRRGLRVLGWAGVLVMAATAAAMIVTWVV